jgi:HAMP domain-containing protein
MFRKISIKVAVAVNAVLIAVMTIGTILLINKQFAALDANFREQGQYVSAIGAKSVARLLEEAIDNGALSVKDAFDTDYTVIPHFDPPKYHTRYDSYTDKALLTLQDEMLKNQNILYAVTVDSNGYLPTHNSRFQQPITGDKEKDRSGNRTKRIFNDPVGLAAAKNGQEGFIQVYKRDTGETVLDVSSPISVKGKQWGNFRIGLSQVSLQQAKNILLIRLSGIMVAILLCTSVAVIYAVKVLLEPLTLLTDIASKMADGDVNKPIVAQTHDEIGDLAEVLERMRISLKSAMERLMRR